METIGRGHIRHALLPDVPFDGEGDPLGFAPFADALSSLVADSVAGGPLVVGVEGPWGCGKSTMLRQVAARISSRARTVWFSPWKYDGKALVVSALLSSIAKAIPPNLLRELYDRRTRQGLTILTADALGGVLRVGQLGSAVEKRFARHYEAMEQFSNQFEELTRRWLSADGHRGGRPADFAAVFVDDLDRCLPQNSLEILEAIKLFFGARRCVFFLAYDRNALRLAVQESHKYLASADCNSYIDKIVQVEMAVPTPGDQQLHSYISSCLMTAGLEQEFGGVEEVISRAVGVNPRRIKTFINTFATWATALDRDEMRAQSGAVAFLLLIRIVSRQFFEELASDPELVVKLREYLRQPDGTTRSALPRSFLTYALNDDLIGVISRTDFSPVALSEALQLLRHSPALLPGAVRVVPQATVLWIDDNPANIKEPLRELQRSGVRIMTATSSDEAREALAECGIDTLVSDTRRGDNASAGFDFLRELRASGRFTGPAVFYMGSPATPEQARELAELGATAVRDPFTLVDTTLRVLGSSSPLFGHS